MLDLTPFTTRELYELTQVIKEEITKRDLKTKLERRANGPKPVYVKPGQRTIKPIEDQITQMKAKLEKLQARMAAMGPKSIEDQIEAQKQRNEKLKQQLL